MGYVSENDLTEGLRGRVGNKIVFRKLGKRTIAARRPTAGAEVTEKQLAHRQRFRDAAAYARAKMLDPVAKAVYESIAQTRELMAPYSVALTDFLRAPEIRNINTDGYTGKVGEAIWVKAEDDVKVTSVTITITAADGSLIESGDAVLAVGDVDWKYATTKAVAALAGVKVTAAAKDMPGNVTTLDKQL